MLRFVHLFWELVEIIRIGFKAKKKPLPFQQNVMCVWQTEWAAVVFVMMAIKKGYKNSSCHLFCKNKFYGSTYRVIRRVVRDLLQIEDRLVLHFRLLATQSCNPKTVCKANRNLCHRPKRPNVKNMFCLGSLSIVPLTLSRENTPYVPSKVTTLGMIM